MNRAQLECALRDLSQSHGYSFELMPAHRMTEVSNFPVVVLEPLTVARIDGREQGRISYKVTLHILSLAAKLSARERSEIQEKMESDLLDIFVQLSDSERVIAVEELSLTPREFAFTTHGEISQTAQTNVVTFF